MSSSKNSHTTANQATRLIELAINQNADIDRLEKLMALQQRWDADNARKAFYAAMASFQSELPVIKKLKTASFATRNGGTMTYNYASLDDIAEQIKPFLAKHGLSYRFEQQFNQSGCKVSCVVSHKEGHFVTCEMIGAPDSSGNKNSIQQIASTITYLRRYTLTGALGITTADEDIDGRLPENKKPVGYCEKTFSANFATWEAAITSGKTTADQLIAKVESLAPLSDRQKQMINSIGQNQS